IGTFVAQQDPRRIEKTLHCKDDAGSGEVRILRFNGQRQEANGIARICNWLINIRRIDPSEILILVRNDRHRIFSKVLYESLDDSRVPVRIVSNPLAPLETIEGRHFICLLHLLLNRHDHLAWRVILEIRRNNIGRLTFKRVYELARTRGVTFSEALELIASNSKIIPRNGNLIQQEMREINTILDPINLDSVKDLSIFIETFASERIRDDSIRTDVISLFRKIIELTNETDLEKLLRAINISLGDEEQDKHQGYVSIMTMHQAKGLSADAVFIVAAEDEYIPGRAEGEQIDDERRLLYVSLTRARHYLYITHCQRRTGQQQHSGRTSGDSRRTLSRFLSGGPIRSLPAIEYINQLR
ncbi:MAG: ATP-dependent helicase, partial [Candidatus Thermoplasmatota archaeon]